MATTAKKPKTTWVCNECGEDHPKWNGRCRSCGAWNSLVEFKVTPAATTGAALTTKVRRRTAEQAAQAAAQAAARAQAAGVFTGYGAHPGESSAPARSDYHSAAAQAAATGTAGVFTGDGEALTEGMDLRTAQKLVKEFLAQGGDLKQAVADLDKGKKVSQLTQLEAELTTESQDKLKPEAAPAAKSTKAYTPNKAATGTNSAPRSTQDVVAAQLKTALASASAEKLPGVKLETVGRSMSSRAGYAGLGDDGLKRISDIVVGEIHRTSTGFEEFDRVLGGGLVPGSAILVGGHPGAGKSTILLQIVTQLTARNKILYVTGEESLEQVKMRCQRVGLPLVDENLLLLSETSVDRIIQVCELEQPNLVVIDSIQVMALDAISSSPGSVSQVRESAAALTRYAKQTHTSMIMVGHVTKDGTLAGPKVLEHVIDCSLMIESADDARFRIIRSLKNRFGAVNEIGVFQMDSHGLHQVKNPSAIFLSRTDEPAPGSTIVTLWEGSRPLIVEIQALVDNSNKDSSRRVSNGFENNRLSMLLAIMAKHGGVTIHNHEVYVNVVGGIKVAETSADLAVVLAILSSLLEKVLPQGLIILGELGLSGELRPVPMAQERLLEAAKHGFNVAILPAANKLAVKIPHMEIFHVKNLRSAFAVIRQLLGRQTPTANTPTPDFTHTPNEDDLAATQAQVPTQAQVQRLARLQPAPTDDPATYLNSANASPNPNSLTASSLEQELTQGIDQGIDQGIAQGLTQDLSNQQVLIEHEPNVHYVEVSAPDTGDNSYAMQFLSGQQVTGKAAPLPENQLTHPYANIPQPNFQNVAGQEFVSLPQVDLVDWEKELEASTSLDEFTRRAESVSEDVGLHEAVGVEDDLELTAGEQLTTIGGTRKQVRAKPKTHARVATAGKSSYGYGNDSETVVDGLAAYEAETGDLAQLDSSYQDSSYQDSSYQDSSSQLEQSPTARAKTRSPKATKSDSKSDSKTRATKAKSSTKAKAKAPADDDLDDLFFAD